MEKKMETTLRVYMGLLYGPIPSFLWRVVSSFGGLRIFSVGTGDSAVSGYDRTLGFRVWVVRLRAHLHLKSA